MWAGPRTTFGDGHGLGQALQRYASLLSLLSKGTPTDEPLKRPDMWSWGLKEPPTLPSNIHTYTYIIVIYIYIYIYISIYRICMYVLDETVFLPWNIYIYIYIYVYCMCIRWPCGLCSDSGGSSRCYPRPRLRRVCFLTLFFSKKGG